MLSRLTFICALLVAFTMKAGGATDTTRVTEARVRPAVERSLKLLEFSGSLTMEQRACFSCHHGSNPATAAALAWSRGIDPDLAGFSTQLTRTYDQLAREVERLRQARFAGGQGDATGHALWFLDIAGWPRDAVTAAAVKFFVEHEAGDSHWSSELQRPPTVGSSFTTTYVVARALKHYGDPGRDRPVKDRLDRAREWLVATPGDETEDLVYRLRGLHLLDAGTEVIRGAGQRLLAGQREDGGWAQKALMGTDAYATGTALAALLDTGVLDPSMPAFVKGAEYLLDSQEADGSWQVTSRSRQVQPFFQSGFPHGVNQFISIAATSWASYALLQVLPETASRQGRRFLEGRQNLVAEVRECSKPIEFTAEQIAFYTRKVEPVLRERCYSCHSAKAKKLKGGLSVDDPAKLLAGGDSGPSLVPGNPGRSLLIRSLHGEDDLSQMPPKERLSATEIDSLRRWVAMGAPIPVAAHE